MKRRYVFFFLGAVVLVTVSGCGKAKGHYSDRDGSAGDDDHHKLGC